LHSAARRSTLVAVSAEPTHDPRDSPSQRFRLLARGLVLLLAGIGLGVGGFRLWQRGWLSGWNWTALLALATFAAVVTALLPIVREEQRRRRQADLLRFRFWIQFSKLRWLLVNLEQHREATTFFSPGVGGEELHNIEVLLAQAHILEIEEYDWLIFTVNTALPYYGLPLREVARHAPRLVWAIDATLARLNRPHAHRNAPTV
jgi:hypothetical protein